MHLETGCFTFGKSHAPILGELTVNDQCREVQKANGHSRTVHIEKVFCESELVNEELEFKEVFARLAQ